MCFAATTALAQQQATPFTNPAPGAITDAPSGTAGDMPPTLVNPAADIRQPIPLPPPTEPTRDNKAPAATEAPTYTVISALAIVLGLFAGFVWVSRKSNSRSDNALQSEVFEVLGSSQLDPRNQVKLLKCGPRVLLVGITQNGMQTLAEFSDPQEISELISRAGGAKGSFQATLREMSQETTARPIAEPSENEKRRSLFNHGV